MSCTMRQTIRRVEYITVVCPSLEIYFICVNTFWLHSKTIQQGSPSSKCQCYISLSVVYWFPINTFQAEEVRKRMGENEEVTNEFWPTRIVADFGDSDYHGMCELWWRNLIPFCCQCHRYDSLYPCSGVFF